MKILQFDNSSLLSYVTEVALLRSPSVAGSNITLTLDDNSDLVNLDFLLIGELGNPRSEIVQINNAVTHGTTIRVATLVFPHNVGTKIYKIPYNQVKFYRALTLTGTKTLLGTAIEIDADSDYTTYLDNTYSTGYFFITLYNSQTAVESDYSEGYSYADPSSKSRGYIREFVLGFWKKDLDDEQFERLYDLAETELFSIKRWKFREKLISFNTVVGQQAYDLDTIGAEDLGELIFCTYDGNPVNPVRIKNHQALNWRTSTSGMPSSIWQFERNLYFTPIPPEIKAVQLYYYKDSIGASGDSSETSVAISQALGFRILQDLWSVEDMGKSQYFERRYLQVVQAMKLNDKKQMSILPTLTRSEMTKNNINSQIENPIITI